MRSSSGCRRVAVELPQDVCSGQERFLHRNKNMLLHDTRKALFINYDRVYIGVSAREMTEIVPQADTPAILHTCISAHAA